MEDKPGSKKRTKVQSMTMDNHPSLQNSHNAKMKSNHGGKSQKDISRPESVQDITNNSMQDYAHQQYKAGNESSNRLDSFQSSSQHGKQPENLIPVVHQDRLRLMDVGQGLKPQNDKVMKAKLPYDRENLEQSHNRDKRTNNRASLESTRLEKARDEQSKKQINAWREERAPMYLEQLDKHFSFKKDNRQLIEESVIWREADIKGNRKTFYIKEVCKQNDLIMNVTEMDRLEKLENKVDGWPLLETRKSILRVKLQITMVAEAIINNTAFETISIIIILLNCVTLAMEDPTQTEQSQTDLVSEWTFQILYTIEMCLKILGMGLIFGHGAYLRDSWNILDFVIVMSAWVSIGQEYFFPEASSFEGEDAAQDEGLSISSLRAFRVLRPLRAITSIEGLKILVRAVLKALPELQNTIIVLIFFFLIFATGGVNLFSGMLKNRCVNYETGRALDDEEYICGSSLMQCPEGYFCGKQDVNPNYEVTNFDNIFWALLVIFQCITLEGWSDIQKMYQQAYTYYAFFFFVPMVFIGAFFLLNLTLAVINSKFSETMKENEESKKRQEAESKQFKIKQSQDDELQENIQKSEQQKLEERASGELGIRSFYIAKKAAQKMITWYYYEKEYQDEMEQRKREKEEQLDTVAKFTLRTEELDISNNQQSVDYLMGDSQYMPSIQPSSQTKQLHKMTNQKPEISARHSIESQQEGLDGVPEQFDEDDNHSEKVADFLHKLQDKEGNDDSSPYENTPLQRPPTVAANINWEGNLTGISARNMFTILPEMRRTNFEKGFTRQSSHVFDNLSFQNSSRVVPLNLNQTIGDPMVSHRRDQSGSRLLSRRLDNEELVNEEFGFDKIIKEPLKTLEQSHEQQAQNRGENRKEDDQASYDMSFIGNPLYDNIAHSDQGENKGLTFDDGTSSVIQSDILSYRESQNAPVDYQPPAQNLISIKQKDIKRNSQIRRILTGNFRREEQQLNDTKLSTQYEGSQKAEELFDHGFTDQQPQKRPSSSLSDITHNLKKRQSILYAQVDQDFLDKRNFDPNRYIDKKSQKIVINPGIPYISTSQDAVFELRNAEAAKKIGKQTNQFIALPKEHENSEQSESDLEELFAIKPQFEAYQLKNVFIPVKKLELEIDDDDQDALILVLQPYETVMDIGYGDLLKHLPTKFFCRRSDIIVSSTLSITLTPKDYQTSNKMNFGEIDESQVNDWVNYWQKSRAKEVYTNNFARAHYRDSAKTRYSSDTEGLSKTLTSYMSSDGAELSRSRSMSPSSVSSPAQKLKAAQGSSLAKSRRGTVIPPSGLTALLDEAQINEMKDNERKNYNVWKEKYKTAQSNLQKMPIHPNEKTYTLKEAQKLEQGLYHEDDDNDEELNLDGNTAPKQQVYLARDNIEQDLKLDEFEKAVKAVIEDNGGLEKLNEGNSIPQEIRQELNLPKDMKGFEIDYNQVRITDAQRSKKNRRKWSGQDVLEHSLSNDSSEWITNFLNKVRVFPKASAGYVKKARCLLKQFVRTPLFENFMTISVLINTIVMAMDRYEIGKKEAKVLDDLNQIFTWIFIVEMTFKLLAIGPAKYVADRMNILDGAVVILSIIEIIITETGDGNDGGGNLQAFRTVRVFRTFRVLRVTRLLRGLESMVLIINVFMKSFEQFFYITVLMFTFVFIYALLGMQTFGGRYNFGDEDPPRGNFDSFEIAFVTVFQVLTMENWQLNLYQSMRTSNPKYVTAIFYVSWIFIGNFILLNLLLAILLDSFVNDEEVSEEQIEAEKQAELQKKEFNEKERRRRLQKLGKSAQKLQEFASDQFGIETKKKAKKSKKTFTAKKLVAEEFQMINNIEDLTQDEIRKMLVSNSLVKTEDKDWHKKDIDPSVECQNSIYLFDRKKRFRVTCYNLQKHKYFDRTIMTLIAFSSLKLATDTYMDGLSPESTAIKVSNICDSIFTWAFTLECVIKIIALGFAMDDGSYVRDSWNQLDFFIVITSLIDFFLRNVDLPFIKILRLLRTLRPLRVISHNKSLRLIVTALFESVGSIFNVSIVVLVVWLMFAIFGINSYKGQLFYCSIDKYFYHLKQTCEEAGGEWLRWDSNFDNIFQAMMTLFVVSSLEGWPDIMYHSLDIVGEDKGPKFENDKAQSIFYIVFILIGSFLFLNFFIGVLFLKYTQAKNEETKGYLPEHLNWMEMQSLILSAKCPHDVSNKPSTPLRIRIWRMVSPAESQTFDNIIMVVIVLNMFQMAMSFEGASNSWNQFLEISNYIFTFIFFVEACLKLFAYGKSYFDTAWNRFDFFVVISSLIDVGLKLIPDALQSSGNVLSVGPQLARVMRVLRVTRVLRLSKTNPGLTSLLQTIEMSVSSLINVFLLLMLIFFMLATLGVFWFKDVTEGDVVDPKFKNFKTFGDGFLLLFAISTGEDWNKLMYDCWRENDIAPLYFIVFILLVTHIMLNLFILVIIEQFERYYLSDDNPLEKFRNNLESFINEWQQRTAQYRCVKIKERYVTDLYMALPPPLGPQTGTRYEEIKKRLLKMGIKSDQGWVYFNELFYRLMRDVHCNFKLNKQMQIVELTTQFKLYQLQQKAKGEISKLDPAGNDFVTNEQSSVNPFLTMMFRRITFKAWRNLAANMARREELGSDLYDRLEQDHTESGYEQVEYERPPEYFEYTSEEEAETLQIDQRSNDESSLQELRDVVEDQTEKDPLAHRRKVRQQKLFAQRRLSSAIWLPGMLAMGESGLSYSSPKTREKAHAFRSQQSKVGDASKSQNSNGFFSGVNRDKTPSTPTSKSNTSNSQTESSQKEITDENEK